MQSITREKLVLETRVERSYRVARILGALERTDAELVRTTIEYEPPPGLDEEWRVGLVVGPSGAGKTSIARKRYGTALYTGFDWDARRAIIDQFEPRPFEELVAAFASVGLASLPTLARPYGTLSGGERLRCDLAKALLDLGARNPVVAFDEYASALDYDVARACSIALRKALDRRAFGPTRFVAIACRNDVEESLEPDWTLDMTTGTLRRGRLRRNGLPFELYEGGRQFWPLFQAHHYLSGSLNRASRVFIATTLRANGEVAPVAFAAVMQLEGRPGVKRVHRLVVRPEFQGIGLGGAFLDAIAERLEAEGAILRVSSGNLLFLRKLSRSSNWRLVAAYPHGKTQRRKGRPDRGSFGRALATFEWRAARNEIRQPQLRKE